VLSAARARTLTLAVLAFSLLAFLLHVASVRPYLWPAGAGLTLNGDALFTTLAAPSAVPRIRPPHIQPTDLEQIVITEVAPNGAAVRAGLAAGARIQAPDSVAQALIEWRERYRRGPRAQISVTSDAGQPVSLMPEPMWQVDADRRSEWLRAHLGAITQMGAFLAGACILVALGTTGVTATLITLALIFTAVANSGSPLGAELQLPLLGEILLLFAWLATPFSFPIIGLAVLHFPSRAPILDRHPWITTALPLLPGPIFIISGVSAAFLLGVDAALAPLTWFAVNGWLFDASFAIALGANVLIVIEGIHRYRTELDVSERRRIQLVVYTGVSAVFAYAIKAGVPLVASLAGRPTELPWLVEGVLQGIVLLPAFALPYAVAVKHVFSPRTVLRRSLQYALARRTLSVLMLMPVAALIASLVRERDRPLADIVMGQPLFYAISLALVALGWRFRDQAQRALDKQFFRAEYDAREILVSLANRVPYEHDAARLVSLVITQIDDALHPESIAVLAGDDRRLEVLSAVRTPIEPLATDSGLATLLRWSDEPLELYLDDERSPASRLPAADREWIANGGVALLVPIFAGAGSETARALVGVLALGQKRSEEPYTTEDRRLLSGIATQMSVALDLSRLRKRESSNKQALGNVTTATPTLTPTMVADTALQGATGLMMCPICHRCYDSADVSVADGAPVCPSDGTWLQPVIGMTPIVDGKYRVEAVIGRGGMGAVFRARDVRLQRDVAVKIVRADVVGDPDSRARFQREAQIVAQLQHPAIVTVFDFGTLADGAAFLVMEYVRGEDLRHLLKREKLLAPRVAAELMTGVATGVDAAHRAGVLHRDLKPENILLPASGTGPKVLDFGVAKITDPAAAPSLVTHGATIVGTPAYMAPEQLRGDAVDSRADVYSLAVVTFEGLTGRLPFGTGTFIDVAVNQTKGVEAVSFAGVPAEIVPLLRRALSPSRESRPATAAAFAEELGLLL
jgi:predicted Ser/Thr protein kinase